MRPTASASAALFALWMSAPASRSCTVIRSPACERDPRLADLRGVAGDRDDVVGFRCFSATSTVISFVMLAIGTDSCALCDASTSPVAAFMT